MSDQPLTKQELAEVHRYRIGKSATKALPKDGWRNPAHVVKFLGEQIARERARMWKKER